MTRSRRGAQGAEAADSGPTQLEYDINDPFHLLYPPCAAKGEAQGRRVASAVLTARAGAEHDGKTSNCATNPNCIFGLHSPLPTAKSLERSALEAARAAQLPVPRHASRPVGLINLAATCYVNVFLQAFFHQPAFRQLILSYERPAGSESADLVAGVQGVFARLMHGAAAAVAPRDFVNMLNLNTSEHQDVQEFLNLVLEGINAQLTAANTGSTLLRRIPALFEWSAHHFTLCLQCGRDTSRAERYTSLVRPFAVPTARPRPLAHHPGLLAPRWYPLRATATSRPHWWPR